MATQRPETRRSPAWEQNVDRPEAWAREHKWLLDEVFAAFDRDGDWPRIEAVQRVLADSDAVRAVSVAQLAIDIPAELGAREVDRLVLRSRALSYCDEATELLSILVAAIKMAVEVYRASDAEHPPVLSGSVVKSSLGLDDLTYVAMSRLLFQEGWFFSGGSGNVDEDWQRNVRVEVLLAEHAEDINDYLDAVAKYRFGEPYIEEDPSDRYIVKLERDWEIGEQIGEGGFGRVMLASSGDVQAVAKFVPKEPGARRELLFVDLGSARNVVPVIDHGETDESWVLIMPRADLSLRQRMKEVGDAMGADEARTVLTDVATTLVDLAGSVVHRDIKPENVLRLDGHWCLSDFGISRYTEATTALDTHKFAMSPPYAAPERWRAERATGAADVYGLGVMGYEMLRGVLPFTGPHLEDFREQHLHSDLPSFANIDASLAAIIEACLIKASGARPLPADLLARLEQAGAGVVPPGLARLKEANRNESTRIATAARRASQASTEGERRADLFVAASKSLRTMCNTLIETVGAAAPDSESRAQLDGPWAIKLGAAELRIFSPQEHARSQASDQRIPFDVVAFTDVELSMSPDHYGYSGRSHALWFCDAQQAGNYAWFETAFMLQPLMAQQSNRDPFSLKPGAEAGESVGPGMNAYQVAWPFTKLDHDSLEDFINRWAGWFADAADGRLHRPNTMPEGDPQGSWRQA
jgi:eukaryotic-like serine/threonine-protein kinase